jgi:hypothetical protein
MDDAAFYGLAGEIVAVLAQDAEPCRESLLAQFLVAIGNVIGRSAHCRQGGTHHLNEFAVLIGETARGRKGTSWGAIENLIKTVDQNWATRVRSGFQSGESIINAVRDQMIGSVPPSRRKPGQPTQIVIDPGVSDKRLMILEEEFARLLTVGGRKENTLFSALRDAWDGKEYLYTEAKNSAQKATGALISMIGHVTAAELIKTLHQVEHLSGFSNRFLWVAVQRTNVIPLPIWIDWGNYPELIKRLTDIIGTLKISGRRLHWSDSGKAAWRDFYHSIRFPGNGGVLGSIIARCDAHTLRLAMLYAVLDRTTLMTPDHLAAAIAFWQYCHRSAAWALGQQTGNRMADRILWALQHEPQGMTRTDIQEVVFNKNSTNTRF